MRRRKGSVRSQVEGYREGMRKASQAVDAHGDVVDPASDDLGAPSRGIFLKGFGTDLESLGYQDPLRVTLSLDLDPTTLLAIQCVLDARENGLDIRIVTQPDLIRAVDERFCNRHESSSLVRVSELPTPDTSGRTLEEAADGRTSRDPSAAPSSEEEAVGS